MPTRGVRRLRMVLRFVLATVYVAFGVLHLVAADGFMAIVPPGSRSRGRWHWEFRLTAIRFRALSLPRRTIAAGSLTSFGSTRSRRGARSCVSARAGDRYYRTLAVRRRVRVYAAA